MAHLRSRFHIFRRLYVVVPFRSRFTSSVVYVVIPICSFYLIHDHLLDSHFTSILLCINSGYLANMALAFKMIYLAEIDSEEPDALERLFRDYLSLDEGVVGVRFQIARRLLTVSMEQESPLSTTRRLDQIRRSASLRRTMIKLLEEWIQFPSSQNVRHLSVDAEEMSNTISRENQRLHRKPKIIRNTVRRHI